MIFHIEKTMILFDENNYLIYINHSLLKEKGSEYKKEKKYMKKFVEMWWNATFQNPDKLKDAEKIDTLKEVFGIKNLEII